MSSGTDGATDAEGREMTEPSMPLEPLDAPQNSVCNERCNADDELRGKIAAAVLAGDDAEATRLMALLGRMTLRVVG